MVLWDSKTVIINRELGEWLSQQFAKLSFRNGRKGSNPLLSASVVSTTDLGASVLPSKNN